MPFTSLLPQEQEEITISPPRRSQIQKRPRSPSSTINRTFIQSPPIYTNTIPMKKTTGNSSTKRKRIAILWFRKDLRLHDNLAIEEALKKYRQEEKENKKMLLIPIYIIHKPKLKRCGAVRFQFLIESIEDLSKQLISKQNQLIVLRGDALEVFKIILPAWKVTDLFFDEYILPYAIKKDQEIIQLAQNKYQIQVHTTKGFLLYNPHEILQKNQGKVPLDFDLFCKLLSEMEQPSLPLPTPIQINGFLEKETSPQRLYELLYEYHGYQYGDVIDKIAFGCRHRSEEDLKNILKPFSVPKNVKEFELEPPIVHSFIYGGETKALEALTNFCNCEERVGLFDKPRTCPVFIPHENPSTTCLSPFLAFGCLSCREFFYRIMFIELRYPNIVKGPPSVTLDGQLLWREFFYCFSIHTPFFDCQKKNIHCLQINWRLLELPDLKNNDDQETQSQKQQQQQQALAMEHYTCWMEGRTGFPWIDAIMKQILQEGWAHHLARYAVASFLTRGGLYIAWKRGAEFMEENLIDLDEPLNIGNWLWISASCFSHDYTILYSPTKFPQAWDKTGTFIRKYLPALSKMPEKYIFEPWKAPLRIQRKSNCLIGKDYPFPIIDYQTAKKKCIDLLHLEYIKKQYGKVDYDH